MWTQHPGEGAAVSGGKRPSAPGPRKPTVVALFSALSWQPPRSSSYIFHRPSPDRLLGGRRVAVGAPSALSPAGWRGGPDGTHDAMSLSLRRGRHQTSGSGRALSAPLLPRGGRPPPVPGTRVGAGGWPHSTAFCTRFSSVLCGPNRTFLAAVDSEGFPVHHPLCSAKPHPRESYETQRSLN